jgi:microcompartment protein CcmK/EutM
MFVVIRKVFGLWSLDFGLWPLTLVPGRSATAGKNQVQRPKTKDQRPLFQEMIIAKVLGNVVATQKNHRYENARVMMCEQMTPEGDMTGHTVLALDAVDAGVGDTVLIVQEGWSASTVATGKAGAAIDSAIVGVVDRIDLLETET